MKKIMWIIACVTLVGTAFALRLLPDSIPMHYDAAGNINRWGSKYEQFIFPAIILVFVFAFTLLIRYYENKAAKAPETKEGTEARSNAKVLGVTGIATTAMFTVLHGVFFYMAYQGAVTNATTAPFDIGKVSCIITAVLLIVFGNIIPKSKMNSTVGVRVVWSMYNDTTWRKTNLFGGYVLIAAGILTLVLTALVSGSGAATALMLVVLLIAVAVIMVYAYSVYSKEREKDNMHPQE